MSPIVELLIDLKYGKFFDGMDKQKSFYTPGDLIAGTVYMDLNRRLPVRNLTLNVHGQAQTAWDVPLKKKSYEAIETYLDHVEPLMNHRALEHNFPQGRHKFHFRFQLPSELPSSFNGAYGSITYVAKAILEAEDELNDTVTSIPFMILRRDPLPIGMYQQVLLKKSKTIFGLEMGKVRVMCNLEHAIAVPGDTINMSAKVENYSGKDITLLQGAIVLESQYLAQGKSIVFRQYLSKKQDFCDVNLQWGRTFSEMKIQVPPFLADSGLNICRIINIRYLFQFKVQVSGSDDIVVETPLFVGYHQGSDYTSDPKLMLMKRMLSNDQPPSNQVPHTFRPQALEFSVVGDRLRDNGMDNLGRFGVTARDNFGRLGETGRDRLGDFARDNFGNDGLQEIARDNFGRERLADTARENFDRDRLGMIARSFYG